MFTPDELVVLSNAMQILRDRVGVTDEEHQAILNAYYALRALEQALPF